MSTTNREDLRRLLVDPASRSSIVENVARSLSKTGTLEFYEEELALLSEMLNEDEVVELHRRLVESGRLEFEWREEFEAIFEGAEEFLPEPQLTEQDFNLALEAGEVFAPDGRTISWPQDGTKRRTQRWEFWIMIRAIIDFWKGRRERGRQAAKARAEEFERRLSSPDFELIRRHFDKPISDSLRALYSDSREIQRESVIKLVPGKGPDEGIFVCWYEPLDERALQERWPAHPELYQFADDGSGSKYAVDPSDDAGEILYLEHETGEVRPTGVKMSEYSSLEDESGF